MIRDPPIADRVKLGVQAAFGPPDRSGKDPFFSRLQEDGDNVGTPVFLRRSSLTRVFS